MTTGFNRELDGLLAICVEHTVAALYSGLILTAVGARMIKVEQGYDKSAHGQSVFFAWLNRSNTSIACAQLSRVADLAKPGQTRPNTNACAIRPYALANQNLMPQASLFVSTGNVR